MPLSASGALVKKDGKAGAPLEAAAKHIGFSGAHGTARTVLSALGKFGLTGNQRGRVVPTQLALDILHFPEDHQRNQQARQSAALSPAVYKEILDRYSESGNLPSAESLKAELLADMGFNPRAVEAFINDFFETLNYAGLLEGNRLLLSSSGEAGSRAPSDSGRGRAFKPVYADDSSVSERTVWPVSPSLASHAGGKQMRELTLPLIDNEFAYLRIPTPLSEENYDYLMQQMAILRRGLVQRSSADREHTYHNVPEEGITHEMRRKLLALGRTPAEIAEMSAQDAWVEISGTSTSSSGD